ncbi:MAG: hypothetical protein KAT16_10755 [Candidatus Heimdallarchaeota archaeon]|nr:hypothetical protein [Candidatus Heimdallarchaeota archaeon]
MQVNSNWLLFVAEEKIVWEYGNPDDEFQAFVINFLKGLSNLGEEIFGQNGVASIEFDLHTKSQIRSSEVFIVNLSDKFFLIMSDPATTMFLIQQQGGIAKEVEEIMSAVLVGQAAILYAQCISEVDQSERSSLESIWQNIILDISDSYSKDITKIVSSNSSNFSMLAFEDLLFLHYYLRKQPELIKPISPQGWAIVSHYSGGEIPIEHNMEKDGVVLAGYLGIIISFISVLFNSKPKKLTFGIHTVQSLSFINGIKDYFIAIDSPFTKLILDKDFKSQFDDLDPKVLNDMKDALHHKIVEEILEANTEELESQNLETLLKENVFARKSLFTRLFSKKK